jgi:hypothetical protein
MAKVDAEGWNSRVWDDRPCCWNCDCTGVRWKLAAHAAPICGFSAWSAPGSTNKDGDEKMASYGLLWGNNNKLRAARGGPDEGYTTAGNIFSGVPFAERIAGKFLEVHLTETGADLVLDGATVHSIELAPVDSQYRFGCATTGSGNWRGDETGAGYTDLAYYARSAKLAPGQVRRGSS